MTVKAAITVEATVPDVTPPLVGMAAPTVLLLVYGPVMTWLGRLAAVWGGPSVPARRGVVHGIEPVRAAKPSLGQQLRCILFT